MENATENQIEEGTEILDQEEKAKVEKNGQIMKEVNAEVTKALTELQNKFGVKLMLLGLHPEMNQIGIWKTKNLTTLDELGFSKLLSNQF